MSLYKRKPLLICNIVSLVLLLILAAVTATSLFRVNNYAPIDSHIVFKDKIDKLGNIQTLKKIALVEDDQIRLYAIVVRNYSIIAAVLLVPTIALLIFSLVALTWKSKETEQDAAANP